MTFADLDVLTFRFRAIQLNRLDWRNYLHQPNPVAAARMAKMKIAPAERPKVKAECLRLLVTLRLDPARTQLISQFIDIYLRLNPREERAFQAEIDTMESTSQEEIMQITTSEMERGRAQGLEQGRREEARSLVLR
jgi:flagellar biosynthesis/type III secretory pathway protein FliH